MAQFKKGQSGNPQGRPKDNRTAELRGMLRPYAPDLVAKVKDMAMEGDATAMRLCLERILPPLRARDEAMTIPTLDSNASLVEQGQAIVAALSAGQLSPADAATLMQTVTAQARLVEVEELEQRVTALEAK
ncbi:DUF5681 domain-containing protein [Salinisphaera sp. SWV1]|uniref:DUF5681 domain-containing protein n=1 Tax=Salinisphaera sp. SWV1 TaxID=3454139 RepID=UPI003F872945